MSFTGNSSSSSSSQLSQRVNTLSLEQIPDKITLISSDSKVFHVEGTAAVESELLKNLMEGGCADEEIPLDNVNATILTKIIEYCKKHVGGKYDRKDMELKKWDAEFMELDLDSLYYLFLGAHYMSVRGLLELCGQTVADKIKGKTPEEMREILNMKNDFTPEEEEAYRKQYPWAFESINNDDDDEDSATTN